MSLSTVAGLASGLGSMTALLLAPGAGASTAVFLAATSFNGKDQVDCQAICQADGGQSMGWSWSSTGDVVQWKCSCSGGQSSEIVVECTMNADGVTFLDCCPAGSGCHPQDDPSPQETALQKDLYQDPDGEKELQEEGAKADGSFAKEDYDCPACAGTNTQFTNAEISKALGLHNKFRSMVGSKKLKWNCKLMCQVQKHADKCVFAHSDSYSSPISAGENLASGKDMDTAVWMWFSEYGLAPEGKHAEGGGTGHFTAMVWKATTELGCGICREGSGNILCQYANSPPNFATSATSYKDNVPVFDGAQSTFESSGFDTEQVRRLLQQFQSWGLPIGSALTRFYSLDGVVPSGGNLGVLKPSSATEALVGCIAGASLAAAVAVAASALRRGRRSIAPLHGDVEDAAYDDVPHE